MPALRRRRHGKTKASYHNATHLHSAGHRARGLGGGLLHRARRLARLLLAGLVGLARLGLGGARGVGRSAGRLQGVEGSKSKGLI